MIKLNQSGFALVESMLATVILAVVVSAFLGAMISAQQAVTKTGSNLQAIFLADEGLEAVRGMRDLAPEALVAGTYGLQLVDSHWTLSESPDTQENFERTLVIEDLGSNRWRILVTVNWLDRGGQARSVALESRLSEWAAVIIPPPPPEI